MVKHVILWQLKDELSAEEKVAVKKGIKEGLESLAGKIPGLLEIKVQTEGLASSNADVMLDSSFEDEVSFYLDAYQNLESTGKRFVGGFCDGTGNLPKLIRYGNACASCGGFYYNHGKFNAVAKLRKVNDGPKGFLDQGSCAVVLRNV